jgi:hypothetical protein
MLSQLEPHIIKQKTVCTRQYIIHFLYGDLLLALLDSASTIQAHISKQKCKQQEPSKTAPMHKRLSFLFSVAIFQAKKTHCIVSKAGGNANANASVDASVSPRRKQMFAGISKYDVEPGILVVVLYAMRRRLVGLRKQKGPPTWQLNYQRPHTEPSPSPRPPPAICSCARSHQGPQGQF